jgi:hypothetical protein
MAETLISSETFTSATGAGSRTFTHGLQDAQGTALVPDFYIVEFLADPGSGARYWTTSKSSSTIVIGYNTPNPVSVRVTAVYLHSVAR